jgi:hypothetical protein
MWVIGFGAPAAVLRARPQSAPGPPGTPWRAHGPARDRRASGGQQPPDGPAARGVAMVRRRRCGIGPTATARRLRRAARLVEDVKRFLDHGVYDQAAQGGVTAVRTKQSRRPMEV